MVRGLILTPDQIERVREAGGPLAEIPDLSDLKDEKTLVAVEVDGRIVAYWMAFYALHLDPLFIAEDHRANPAVNRLLLELMGTVIARTGEAVAFAVIEQAAPHLAQAERLGFARTPGDLYYVSVPAPEPVGG